MALPARKIEAIITQKKKAVAALRYDPTRTIHLRNAFVRDLNKRFRALRGIIRRAIIEQDCFGMLAKEFKVIILTVSDFSLPGRKAFAFPRSEEKVNAFMNWLQGQEAKGILEVGTMPQIGTSIETAWTNKYIKDSYQRGVQRARQEMKAAGYKVPPISETGGISASMTNPFHMDRLGVLYSRVFQELKGITSQMDTQISRVLSQGIADGENPRKLAKLLTKTISGPVGDLGITDTLGRFIPAERRAQTLARTEIIRAHHQGNIQEMKNWAVEGVKVKAEWVTAGYKVCPECAVLEGKVFSLDEIQNKIPLHPNCRCVAIPMKAEEKKVGEVIELPEVPNIGPKVRVPVASTEILEEEELIRAFERVGGDVNMLEKGGKLKGFYSPRERSIYLSKSVLKKVDKGVTFGNVTVDDSFIGRYYHEYAHHVWSQMPVEQKIKWAKLYDTTRPDYWRVQISYKASKGAEEAFAELYAAAARGVSAESRLKAVKGASKYFYDDILEKTLPKLPKMPKTVELPKVPGKVVSTQEHPMNVIGGMHACLPRLLVQIGTYAPLQACSDFVREGKKWKFKGKLIEDKELLERLDKMRLPPAWKNVIVARDPNAKIQAIGLDGAGRWQYRYSAAHIGEQARKKFDRIKSFSRDMQGIERKIEEGITQNHTEAFLLRLENKTAIRAGSDTDFKARKKAYGLTTLLNQHVEVSGNRIRLDFIAKQGKRAVYELTDEILAPWLKERKAFTSAGEKLFADSSASKVNAYLKKKADGKKYTIKDFRTYHGTRLAREELKKYAGKNLSVKERKKIVKEVSEKVSTFLHNTPTMAKNSYIDPIVWDYIGGLP